MNKNKDSFEFRPFSERTHRILRCARIMAKDPERISAEEYREITEASNEEFIEARSWAAVLNTAVTDVSIPTERFYKPTKPPKEWSYHQEQAWSYALKLKPVRCNDSSKKSCPLCKMEHRPKAEQAPMRPVKVEGCTFHYEDGHVIELKGVRERQETWATIHCHCPDPGWPVKEAFARLIHDGGRPPEFRVKCCGKTHTIHPTPEMLSSIDDIEPIDRRHHSEKDYL